MTEIGEEIWPKHLDSVSSLSDVFVPYVTKKLTLGHDHPQQLVEPIGLSLVDPPDITYKLKMEARHYEPNFKKVCHVSKPQLETITYAMQAFQQKIRLCKNGPEVTRGYFLGSGTGTGKTRELAGVIYECIKNDLKKFVWVTSNKELYGGIESEIKAFRGEIKIAKDTISTELMAEESPVVLLLTYYGLSDDNEKINRHLWLRDDFNGVIVLDEVHKAKSAYSKKVSEVGQNVIELQEMYPNAKFMYSTATSASEVSHLRVMKRLGTWGPGTSFEDEADFLEKIVETGVQGIEVLALRLKQEGVFSSKIVDFSSCLFHCEDAVMPKHFTQIYERYSQMWNVLMAFRNRLREHYLKKKCQQEDESKLLEELDQEDGFYEEEEEDDDDETDEEGRRKRANIGGFYSDCLLFFSSIIKSSKLITTSDITRRALLNGQSVIIGLQHTGDTLFDEFIKEPGNEGKPYSNALLILRRAMLNLGIEVGCQKYYGKGFPNGTPLWNWREETEEALNRRARSSVWRERVDFDALAEPANKRFSSKCYKYGSEERIREFPEYTFGAYFVCEQGPLKRPKYLTWSYDQAMRDLTPASIARLYHELSFWLPINGMDELIARIECPLKLADGKEENHRVAELTGREKQYRYHSKESCWKSEDRIILAPAKRTSNGKIKNKKPTALQKRVTSSELEAFMSGKKRVAIISGAASTGVSLHADKSCKNTQKRIHITIEYSFGPENIVQQLGRSNRSNQATSPEYYIIKSPVPAEIRVTCVAGKRVRQLGAICYGHINGAVISNYLCDDFSTHDQSRLAIDHGFKTVEKEYKDLMDNVGLSKIRYLDKKAKGSKKQYFTKRLETFSKKIFNKVMAMPLDFQTKFINEATEYLNKCTEGRTIYSPIKDIDLRLYSSLDDGVVILNHEKFKHTSMYHYRLKRWCPWSTVEKGHTFYMRKLDYSPDIVAIPKVDGNSLDADDGNKFVYGLFPFSRNKVQIAKKKLRTWYKITNPDELMVRYWWLKYSAIYEDMTERRPGCIHVQKGEGCPIYYNAHGKHCLQKWGHVEFVMLLHPDFRLVSEMQAMFGCTQLVRLRLQDSTGDLKSVLCLVIGQEEIRERPSEVFNSIFLKLRLLDMNENGNAAGESMIVTRRSDEEDSDDSMEESDEQ